MIREVKPGLILTHYSTFMKAKFFLSCIALAILFSACNTTNRTPKQKIEQQIDSLLKDKKATVGVAVLANDETVAVYNN